MKRELDLIIMGTALVILFGLFSTVLLSNKPVELTQQVWQGSWACASDTLQCLDGTSVSRVPPYCLFAACSGE